MGMIVKRTAPLVLIILMLVLHSPILAAQTDSTPEAEPESVHFSLHAVGDFDGNFFEDVEVQPGESVTLEVMVVNWNPDPVDIRIFNTNANNSVNGGFMAATSDEEPAGSALWLGLPVDELTLEGDEQRLIAFDVTVPEGTEPGQYISSIVAETVETMPIPGEDAIDHSIRYAISVGILVPGDLNASFELGEPGLRGDVLEVPITNTGNVLVRPAGDISLQNGEGEVVMSSPLELGSIYAGNTTNISLGFPAPLPEDDYTLNLQLTDPDSGSEASLDNAPVMMLEEQIDEEPTVQVISASVDANADPIVYANVDLTLQNDGEQIPVTVVLEVYRDGELVEEFDLATNQVFVVGENEYSSRYLPEVEWESGTYTFSISVLGTDPESGQRSVILTEELDAEIVVP